MVMKWYHHISQNVSRKCGFLQNLSEICQLCRNVLCLIRAIPESSLFNHLHQYYVRLFILRQTAFFTWLDFQRLSISHVLHIIKLRNEDYHKSKNSFGFASISMVPLLWMQNGQSWAFSRINFHDISRNKSLIC